MTAQTTASEIQVDVETAGPVTRTVRVRLPAERVDAERRSTLQELRRHARVPGFRPGKAPEPVLERLYGDRVASTVIEKLVRTSLDEAIGHLEERVLNVVSIRPVGTPAKAEPFTYEATVEVPPTFELANYKKLKLLKPIEPVSDADVDRFIEERLRPRMATYRPAEADEAIATGDRIRIVYAVHEGDQNLLDEPKKERVVTLGEGELVAAIEERLVGAKAGDRLEFQVTYTEEDAPDPSWVGRTLDVEVEILEVEKRELPDLDDAFAAQFLGDEATYEQLRERVRADLQQARESFARRELEQQAIEQLLAAHDFVVPAGLVERHRERLVEEAAMDLLVKGYPLEEVRKLGPVLAASVAERAEQEVKLGFVLERIAEAEGIEVGDAEVEEALAAEAARSGKPAEELIAEAREQGRFEELRRNLRNRRAIERVLDLAKVKEIDPETYQERRAAERARAESEPEAKEQA